MPPRPARVYHIQVKTHKLTIMLQSLAPPMTIAELKTEVLSALKAEVASDALDVMAMDPPEIDVETEDDFDLCRAIKEKGKPTGAFEVLEPFKALRECDISGWEAVFIQFRDRATGNPLPIKYTLPPMNDGEDEAPQGSENTNKGKRKASAALEEY